MPTTPTSRKCAQLGCFASKAPPSMWCIAHGGGKGETALQNKALYNKQSWRQRRQIELSRQPLCQACLSQGRVVQGNTVDHVFPHRRNPERFLRNVFQVLCAACHTQKTKDEAAGVYRDYARNRSYSDADYQEVCGNAK